MSKSIRFNVGNEGLALVDHKGEIIHVFNKSFSTTEDYGNYDEGNNGTLSDTNVKPSYVKVECHFIKFNEVAFYELANEDVDVKRVVQLLPFIGYRTGILAFNNGKRFTNLKSFTTCFGSSRNTTPKYVKKMIDLGIIKKTKDDKGTCYLFNPFIAMRGKNVSQLVFDEFSDTKWRWINTMEKKGKSIYDIDRE